MENNGMERAVVLERFFDILRAVNVCRHHKHIYNQGCCKHYRKRIDYRARLCSEEGVQWENVKKQGAKMQGKGILIVYTVCVKGVNLLDNLHVYRMFTLLLCVFSWHF